MNELQLYELLKNLFQANTQILGRFFVLEGYGQDLNGDGLADALQSEITMLQGQKKYPLVAMLPPVEIPEDRYNRYRCTMYFVVQSYQNNSIQQKGSNNTSTHPIRYDWKDMRTICNDFLLVIDQYLSNKFLYNKMSIENKSIVIRRFANKNADRVAGVQLNIDFLLAKEQCTIETFDIDQINSIVFPEDPHPTHKL